MKIIKLTQGKVAFVDDEDFKYLNKFKWYYNNGYATRNVTISPKKQKLIQMHRIILNTPVGMFTDHIDGNRANNQKKNLRCCTKSENMMNTGRKKTNTSGYKGVSWSKTAKKWIAKVHIGGKTKFLGSFEKKIDAYKAFCKGCIKYHKEFSKTK